MKSGIESCKWHNSWTASREIFQFVTKSRCELNSCVWLWLEYTKTMSETLLQHTMPRTSQQGESNGCHKPLHRKLQVRQVLFCRDPLWRLGESEWGIQGNEPNKRGNSGVGLQRAAARLLWLLQYSLKLVLLYIADVKQIDVFAQKIPIQLPLPKSFA